MNVIIKILVIELIGTAWYFKSPLTYGNLSNYQQTNHTHTPKKKKEEEEEEEAINVIGANCQINKIIYFLILLFFCVYKLTHGKICN